VHAVILNYRTEEKWKTRQPRKMKIAEIVVDTAGTQPQYVAVGFRATRLLECSSWGLRHNQGRSKNPTGGTDYANEEKGHQEESRQEKEVVRPRQSASTAFATAKAIFVLSELP
jgi:hypothetical protein